MIKIYDGRSEFYQWDLDRKLIISDTTVNNIHFSNRTNDSAIVVEVYEQDGVRLANVPNILLQTDYPIKAYAYCGECYTKNRVDFKVNKRSRPADYVYTETETRTWDKLKDDINTATDNLNEATDKLNVATGNLEEASAQIGDIDTALDAILANFDETVGYLISFAINEVNYFAIEGMRWCDWIGSSFDTFGGLEISQSNTQEMLHATGDYYHSPKDYYNNTQYPSSLLVDGESYTIG